MLSSEQINLKAMNVSFFLRAALSTLILLQVTTYQFAFAQKCLVLSLPFNGNANDVSGNSLNGTVHGASLTKDRFGNNNSAYEFDGLDDYIVVNNNSLFNFDVNDDFTISLWVKPDEVQIDTVSTRNSLIEKWEDNNNTSNEGYPFVIRYLNQTSSNQGGIHGIRYDKTCSNAPEIISSNALNSSVFQNILMVRKNGSFSLYINNVLDNTTSDATSCVTQNNDSLFIGKKGGIWGPLFFKGSIDDINIFNCALDSNSIDSLFNDTPWLGLNKVINKNVNFKAYPNPTNGVLNLEIDGNFTNYKIEVLNPLGGTVFTKEQNGASQVRLELPAPKGLYLVRITSLEGLSESRLIMRE